MSLNEILKLIRNRKNIFFGVFLACSVLAIGLSFVVDNVWTAKARVRVATGDVLGDFNFLSSVITKNGAKKNDLADDLRNILSSKSVQIAFIKETPLFKGRQFEDAEDEEKALDLFVSRRINVKEDKDGNINLSFGGPTPKFAQESLKNFIHFANALLANQYLNGGSYLLETEQRKIERQTESSVRYQIESMEEALSVARKANIKNYQGDVFPNAVVGKVSASSEFDSEPSRLFLLGENYLRANIQTLKENKKSRGARYAEISGDSAEVKKIAAAGVKGQAYQYQDEPTLPLRTDSPKKLLVVFAGLLLGFILGVFAASWVDKIEAEKKAP